MRLEMDYDKDFITLYNHFNFTEKGKKYLEIIGISREKLDPATMGKQYFKATNGEDRTVDVNANIGSKSKSPNNFSKKGPLVSKVPNSRHSKQFTVPII